MAQGKYIEIEAGKELTHSYQGRNYTYKVSIQRSPSGDIGVHLSKGRGQGVDYTTTNGFIIPYELRQSIGSLIYHMEAPKNALPVSKESLESLSKEQLVELLQKALEKK